MIWNPTPPPFRGRLAVVGGQCRKVGKTTLVTELIRALRDFEWTAVKITPNTQAGCPVNGRGCACAPDQHTFAIREQANSSETGDTGRFLSAGAKRALWVQTKPDHFKDILAPLAAELEHTRYLIIESNAIAEFWRPDIFLMVLDPANPDFKDSAGTALDLADAFVFRSPFAETEWDKSRPALALQKPKFVQPLGQPLPKGVQDLAEQLLSCLDPSQQGSQKGNRAAF